MAARGSTAACDRRRRSERPRAGSSFTSAAKAHEQADIRSAGSRAAGSATIFRLRTGRALEIRRTEELPLHVGADAGDHAGADDGLALQRADDREGIAQVGMERPGRGHDAVELGTYGTGWLAGLSFTGGRRLLGCRCRR